jgi:hypothetical protein
MSARLPLASVLVAPTLFAALALTGASPAGDPPQRPPLKAPPGGDRQEAKGEGEPAPPPKLTKLKPGGWGTLTGTVTYEGDPPRADKLKFGPEREMNCTQGASERELVNQTWLINPKNKGVSDVIIYLKAPPGRFLEVHDSYLKTKHRPVELRQPHCVFIPHSFYVWAAYRDNNGKLRATGQKVRVVNDAKFKHNVMWEGGPVQGKGDNIVLNEGGSHEYTFKADLRTPIRFKSGIHPWMSATCWALDTPYAARTDENGKFTIENAPLDVELYVVAWHEGAANHGFFHGGSNGTKTTLKKGEELRLAVKKR